MSFSNARAVSIAAVAFAAGIATANFPSVMAAEDPASSLNHRPFSVFIDEVKQNLVFGEQFVGSYTKTVTLSDGSKREITLTPMVHNGMQVVELNDNGGITYLSLDGTTTNDKLMVHVRDNASSQAALKAQGWK